VKLSVPPDPQRHHGRGWDRSAPKFDVGAGTPGDVNDGQEMKSTPKCGSALDGSQDSSSPELPGDRLATVTVRVGDVVDALTMGGPLRHFYDRGADQLVWVFEDELAAAEDFGDGDDLKEAASRTTSGEVDNLTLALRIVKNSGDAFVALPSEREVHLHSIMEDFVETLPESEMQRHLWDGLHRAGAFRRFKDGVHRYDIADEWYRYRDERLSSIARRWAEDEAIVLAD